ncbi:mutator type transposase [Tanacetum coccineum]
MVITIYEMRLKNSLQKDKETKAASVKGMGKKVNTIEDEDKNECPWTVYMAKGENDKWLVRTYKKELNLLQSRKIKAATASFLSKHVLDLINLNPEIPIKAVQDQMQKQFQVGVSKHKAFRAKSKAAEVMKGDARGALKEGFKAGGRELLGLDGAFMKGQYPGQLITAVSVDGNNGIYPVAYGIVESESKDSWIWFLNCLGDDIELYRNSNFTFITDRQKVWIVLPSNKTYFSDAEHSNWGFPVVSALEYVREYLMKRIVVVQKVIEKFDGPLNPSVTKVFKKIKEASAKYIVDWNGVVKMLLQLLKVNHKESK